MFACLAMGSPARSTPDENDDASGSVRMEVGPRALEALLVADLRTELESVRRDPSLLKLPLRVVVPSQSLRDHLAAVLLRGVGCGQ